MLHKIYGETVFILIWKRVKFFLKVGAGNVKKKKKYHKKFFFPLTKRYDHLKHQMLQLLHLRRPTKVNNSKIVRLTSIKTNHVYGR